MNLDAKTLTNVSARLLGENLIGCRDAVVAGRGRPAEIIFINPHAAYGVGIDLGSQQVTGVVVDMAGNVPWRIRREFESPRDKNFLLKQADQVVAELFDSLGKSAGKKVRGIGFCVPGFLDRRRGLAVESVNIRGFKNVPVGRLFQRRFKQPVFLEESSRMMAMAELWFAKRDFESHFICVDLGVGIGMGIVHNGIMYRGSRERSGEIGHTVVEPRGLQCLCGKRGCLETVASGSGLARHAEKINLSKRGIKSKGAKAIYEAAVSGDTQAQEVLTKAGEYIGLAIANVINLFDPDRVILNGGLVTAGNRIVDPLRRAVKAHSMKTTGGGCRVEVSELGQSAGAMGAAMLPLMSFFEFENIKFW